MVTVNTDIPAMIATPLGADYRNVRDAFGYDDAAMADLAVASVQASFAAQELKEEIINDIRDWLIRP